MIEFDRYSCLAKNICTNCNKSCCNNSCRPYIVMDYQMRNSGVGRRYFKLNEVDDSHVNSKTLDFMRDYCANVYENVKKGDNILFTSKIAGTGKTTCAIRIMQEYVLELGRRWKEYDALPHVFYMSVSNFLINCKDGFRDDEIREKVLEEKNKMMNVDLLILDDIGVEKSSDWSRELLYSIINYRYENEKCTIFTSNNDLNYLQQPDILGARIARRIYDTSRIFDFERGELIE